MVVKLSPVGEDRILPLTALNITLRSKSISKRPFNTNTTRLLLRSHLTVKIIRQFYSNFGHNIAISTDFKLKITENYFNL
jgi:hypothetical protein